MGYISRGKTYGTRHAVTCGTRPTLYIHWTTFVYKIYGTSSIIWDVPLDAEHSMGFPVIFLSVVPRDVV